MIYAALSATAHELAQLPEAINSLHPQVDRVFVFLDRPFPYELANTAMAQVTNHDKCRYSMTEHKGDMAMFAINTLKDAGKEDTIITKDDTILFCQPDTIYPPDYAEKIIAKYDLEQAKCVSVGGFKIDKPKTLVKSTHEGEVDIPTPNFAISASIVKNLAPSADFIGNTEIFVALVCRQKEIPIFHVPHKKGWLKVSNTTIGADVVEFSIYEERLQHLSTKLQLQPA